MRTEPEANGFRAEIFVRDPKVYIHTARVASKKQLNVVFYAAKPPKATSRRKRVYRATRGDYATVEVKRTEIENKILNKIEENRRFSTLNLYQTRKKKKRGAE